MNLKIIFDQFFKTRERIPTVKNGKWKEFNKLAILISEGTYLNDKKHGIWREYFDSGELMIEESYSNGVQHGRYTAYHRNGVLVSEGKFVRGSREGEFKVYDGNGNHIKSLWFADNVLVSELEIFGCGVVL